MKNSIEDIKDRDSELEKQVLNWCFENSVFIKNYISNTIPKNVITVFYEDLILNSKKTLVELCSRIDLDYHPDMLKIMQQPSTGIVHSRKEVKNKILDGNGRYLTSRWENEVDPQSLKRINLLLKTFGFEFYLT